VAAQAPQTLGKHQTHIRCFYAFAETRTNRPWRVRLSRANRRIKTTYVRLVAGDQTPLSSLQPSTARSSHVPSRCGRSWHGSFLARTASKGKCRPAQGYAASSFGLSLLTPRCARCVPLSGRFFEYKKTPSQRASNVRKHDEVFFPESGKSSSKVRKTRSGFFQSLETWAVKVPGSGKKSSKVWKLSGSG